MRPRTSRFKSTRLSSVFALVGVLAGLLAGALGGVLSGCARAPIQNRTAPSATPEERLESVCAVGASLQSAKGSVWLKASSPESSGQFPAFVSVERPDRLRMEITNLLGGTEATVSVRGTQYQVEVKKQKDRSRAGTGSWAGIPLRWAVTLFLGEIPCPRGARVVSAESDSVLRVLSPGGADGAEERFEYRLREWAGAEWPERLIWERGGALSQRVEFVFDEPETGSRSPRRWEAKSQQGEIKVRWRDRETTLLGEGS